MRHITSAALVALIAGVIAGPTIVAVAQDEPERVVQGASTPRCQGQKATIVGTRKSERLVGTARRDVIVARGGNDKIFGRGGNDLICAGTGNDIVLGGPGADTVWGQLGNDRLLGGPGPDFLAGQVGDDRLDGGIGVDKCYQGTGIGAVVNCELPPPPPPPEPPTLVIAYTDVNTNHVYDTGDVMIAKIVDTVTDGTIGPGDTIKTGQYPTSSNVVKPAQLRSQFDDWRVKEHVVASADLDADVDIVRVQDSVGSGFYWTRLSAVQPYDEYYEDNTYTSKIRDDKFPGVGNVDWVYTDLLSPSQPTSLISAYSDDGIGDDGLIDVDFAPGV